MIDRLGRGLALAAAACLAFAVAASAEDAKPATTPAVPAVKAKTAAKKPPSECAGLDEPTCATKPVCTWYKEAKLKDGKTRKAHCQKKPTRPAKKPATTPAPATTTAPAPAPKT